MTPTLVLVGQDAIAAYRRFRRDQMAAWQAEINVENAEAPEPAGP
jgi:hypothetical protein